MTPSRSRRPLLLAALFGLALAAAPPRVRAIEARPIRVTLTPAQKQKLLPEWRQLTLQTTRRRIAILQTHQQCVAAAGSLEALRACQQQERQALVDQLRQQREATRLMLQRIGITPPAIRQNGDGRPQTPPPEGVPMI